MTINILHLYYDLMNLYGEIGNIYLLKHSLEKEGLKVIIDNLSIYDEINMNQYDLIYIGCGTEENRNIVLKDILKYKKDLEEYINSDKFILCTGNSIELFGKYINGEKALSIFNFSSKDIDKRIVGDIITKVSFIDKDILGFTNRGSTTSDEVISNKGFNYKNFYGTYTLGPILVRNPLLHEYIIKKIVKSKCKKYKKLDLKLDKNAYLTYINNYYSNK